MSFKSWEREQQEKDSTSGCLSVLLFLAALVIAWLTWWFFDTATLPD